MPEGSKTNDAGHAGKDPLPGGAGGGSKHRAQSTELRAQGQTSNQQHATSNMQQSTNSQTKIKPQHES